MDVVNISRSRRFLRERPIHVTLFDRPRLVVDLLCLEPEQEETRHGFDQSDSLVLVTEGEARLRAGPQIESLQEMDAALVPPGQEYVLTNTGAGQLTAVVILTPKPTRAGEVRVPNERKPFRDVRGDRVTDGPSGITRRTPPRRPPGVEGPRREMAGAPEGRPYRNGPPAERPPYPRRPAAARGSQAGEASTDQRPRRGTTGARAPRRNDGEGPVWYPKPKPAWRPRGAAPSTGGRSRSEGPRATGPRRSGPDAPRSEGRPARRTDGPPGFGGGSSPRGRTGAGGASRGGAGGRGRGTTGDTRRPTRGQGRRPS